MRIHFRWFYPCITLLFIVSIISCSGSPKTMQPSSTPTSTRGEVITVVPTPEATGVVANEDTIAPVPNDCQLDPLPTRKDLPGVAPALGASPIWAVLTASTSSDVIQVHLKNIWKSSQEGWNFKIVWEMEPENQQVITLQAGDLRTKKPLLWHFDPPHKELFTPAFLDPHETPNHPRSAVGSKWKEWGSSLIIPGAGCYYMNAIWPSGQWRITFAAGL